MSSKLVARLALLVAGMFVAASSARAVVFMAGDVFASIGNGQVQHYDKNLNLLETLNTTRGGFTTGMAFDSSGRLYVTNFTDGSISRFSSSGALLESQFVSGISTAPESIVFDAAGNFYVGVADGTRDIRKFNSAGTLLQSFDVATEARGSDWIDLAADGRTMFYTSEHFGVKRYDVLTDTQLPDFATLADRPAFALRLLSTGGLLVADSVNIKRLDATGAVIQTYDVASHNAWFALNLDPDAKSFWSGDSSTGQFHKFDIATGALLASKSTGSANHFGLSVFGEITVAVPPTRGVPDSGATASLLACALLGLGILRKRQKTQV